MARYSTGPALSFDEGEVRRWCGPERFARADALQRGGHVERPAVSGPVSLQGVVRGIWRRRDAVSVGMQGRDLGATCSCAANGPCAHVGALLLHWLRAPQAFARPATTDAGAPVFARLVTATLDEDPLAELTRLLDGYTVANLREIARARDVVLPNRPKAELVAQLAAALAAPESLDVALAALDSDEAHTLDALHLLGATGVVGPEALPRAVRALGGERARPRPDALAGRGIVLGNDNANQPWLQYVVPRAVAARLPTLAHAVRPFRGEGEPPEPEAPPLGIEALCLGIAHALGGRELSRRPGATPERLLEPRWSGGAYPYYGAGGPALGLADLGALQRNPRQIISARLLRSPDLRALATQLGQPPALVAFATHLLAALGILEGQERLQVRDEALTALLALPPAARLARLARAWLGMTDWTDLAYALGDGGRITLNLPSPYPGIWLGLFYDVIALRRLTARLVGRLAPDVVYDGSALVALLHSVAPGLLRSPERAQQAPWIFRRYDPPCDVIDPATPEGWQRIARTLVSANLHGPLSWLGLVEIVSVRPVAFRVHPAAGALVERELALAAAVGAAPVAVADDLTVRVPPGAADPALHALLARVGELVGVGAEGLAYRLTAERVHEAFETGLDGPALLGALRTAAGGKLPAAARRRLEAWWTGYGSVRLYDGLTLVELGEDTLLPELRAAAGLDAAILYQFSPRLIAVAPAETDALLARLARHGYTPRVVETP